MEETWVAPKDVALEALEKSQGDPRVLETLLGLDEEYLGDNPVMIFIPEPVNYRIPSGNEYAAYDNAWRPGGFTSGDIPEAVIDPVPLGNYTVSEIKYIGD